MAEGVRWIEKIFLFFRHVEVRHNRTQVSTHGRPVAYGITASSAEAGANQANDREGILASAGYLGVPCRFCRYCGGRLAHRTSGRDSSMDAVALDAADLERGAATGQRRSRRP
jgi:hypothetical protein